MASISPAVEVSCFNTSKLLPNAWVRHHRQLIRWHQRILG
jgi:hypothetical protein